MSASENAIRAMQPYVEEFWERLTDFEKPFRTFQAEELICEVMDIKPRTARSYWIYLANHWIANGSALYRIRSGLYSFRSLEEEGRD